MKKVLCVGLVCIDIVQTCKSFPIEDSDQRCIKSTWKRGGNASNNCTVFKQLGENCDFLGTSANGLFWNFTKSDFEQWDIGIKYCKLYDNCEFPISTVIINTNNGSRTILHSNRNLPELSLEDFKRVDLTCYTWVHFEGRNVLNVCEMIQFLRSKSDVKVSVELEKPKPDLLTPVPLANVVFIGKDFATFNSWKTTEDVIQALKQVIMPGCLIVCTWGVQGASAWKDGTMYNSPSYPPKKVIDTLGAGDTFCATMIYCLHQDWDVMKSLTIACQIAGAKVGIEGFQGIDSIFNQLNCIF